LRFFTPRSIYQITLPTKIAGENGYNNTAFAVFYEVENYSFGCNQHNQFRVSGSKFRVPGSELETLNFKL